MTKVRFFVMPVERHWTVRRPSRRFGNFLDERLAIDRAVEIAAVISGERGEVLYLEADGRWSVWPGSSTH